MAGYNYYPEYGVEDWIKTYHTRQSAEKDVQMIDAGSGSQYTISGFECTYDWYEVIDLRDWIWGDKNDE